MSKTRKICTLLPFIDICNHRSVRPSCELHFSPTKDEFLVIAKERLNPGQELTISYGPRHNDELLQYFGFVERDNPYDRYVIVGLTEKVKAVLANDSAAFIHHFDTAKYTVAPEAAKEDSLVFHKNLLDPTKIEQLVKKTANPLSLDQKQVVTKLIEWEKECFSKEYDQFLLQAKVLSTSMLPPSLPCWLTQFKEAKVDILESFL